MKYSISDRFRGFLPVVVDVETAGFNAKTDALLEIAAVIIKMDADGRLVPGETYHAHVEPFPGANLEQSALDFTGIDPYHPFRLAEREPDALGKIFSAIRKEVKQQSCTRAIMVAHNPIFDMSFLNAAVERCGIKRNPFHPFSSFDTVTLGGLAYGQTVLARIAQASGMKWNESSAHSAVYDAERTAEIFCTIVNRWDEQNPGLNLPDEFADEKKAGG